VLLTLLPATSTIRVVVVNVDYLWEPPFCFRRRWWVVLLFSKTFFRKKYALTSRTIPLRTSRRISRKVSRSITSFPGKGKEDQQPSHPHNIQLQLYSIIFSLTKNLSIFDKNRGVTGTEVPNSKVKRGNRPRVSTAFFNCQILIKNMASVVNYHGCNQQKSHQNRPHGLWHKMDISISYFYIKIWYSFIRNYYPDILITTTMAHQTAISKNPTSWFDRTVSFYS